MTIDLIIQIIKRLKVKKKEKKKKIGELPHIPPEGGIIYHPCHHQKLIMKKE